VANYPPTTDCTAAMGYFMTIDYDTRVSVSPQPPQDGRWAIFVPASYKNMTLGEAQLPPPVQVILFILTHYRQSPQIEAKSAQLAVKRGSNHCLRSSAAVRLDGDEHMTCVVLRITGIGLCTPLQYADQTAVLQLGHYATKSVLGAHVTRLLAETEAGDPGLSSFRLSEAVRKAAAAAGQARRVTRHSCGPTTKKVKQPPVARNASEWHRLRASVGITPLLKDGVFDGTSRFKALSAVLNNTRQTS
jgi:hypothetical protein